MVLQVYNPSHADASSGWVALTAQAPWPNVDILHIRDTAATISAGTVEVGPIKLPWSPRHVIHGVDGGDGTITAGAGIIVALPKGSAAAITALPRVDSASAISISTPRSTSNGNEYGNLANGPQDFYVQITSVAGTSTTLSVFVQAHRN
jgi:hypothetical protein